MSEKGKKQVRESYQPGSPGSMSGPMPSIKKPRKFKKKGCFHEWHANQDCHDNFCVKCGARQEIYTE